jgi:tetratricopeptide (TPR) repeat protein
MAKLELKACARIRFGSRADPLEGARRRQASPIFRRSLAAVSLALVTLALAAQNPEAEFHQGLAAFDAAREYAANRPSDREAIAERFRVGAQHFQAAWAAGGTSPAVFTNAANSYYFAGDLGEAVLFYRRAAVLAPSDSSIQAALEHIRAQLPIRRATHGAAGSLLRSLFFWHGSLSARVRSVTFMILFPGAFVAFALSLWRGTLWRRVGYLLLALSLAPLGSLLVDAFSSSLRQDAVVLVEVEGLGGDGTAYSASHSDPFPAGTEVTIQETRESSGVTAEEGGWIHVTLLDGSESWIPSVAVERVLIEGL